MSSEISFENYKITERDRYRKIRDGNSDVTFSYLANYVVADMDKREIAIDVDDHFIEMCKKLDGDIELDTQNLDVDDDDIESDSQRLDDDTESDIQKHIYLPQAGGVVVNPIGEQLISFCETDFKKDMEFTLTMLQMRETLQSDMPEGEAVQKESSPNIKKPTSDEELDIIYYENYEYLATVAEDVIRSNLYVNLFPPLARNRSYKMVSAYFNYILALQYEYTKLLDFCFNMDFYREELDGITAASRFQLYCGTTDAVPIRTMNMSFRFTRQGFGNISTPVRDRESFEQLKQNPAKALGSIDTKREPNAFEREYGINPVVTDLARVIPVPIACSYRCG